MKQKLTAPLLIVAAGLLAGSAGIAESGNGDTHNVMLAGGALAAGMIVLGVYLSSERDEGQEDPDT